MQRRHFLGAGASLTLAGSPLLAGAQSQTTAYRQRRLLVLMLRGGMDGLCAIPPTGDPRLQTLRANLVPQPLLRGNDFFGVHPALPTFASLIAEGQAVAVHATGFGYTGRSHIDDAFDQHGLVPNVVITAMDADVIKTYVELGMGVGIVASIAVDAERDHHLFEINVTRLAVRCGTWLRGYAYSFIENFAPCLTRQMVEEALSDELLTV